MADVDVVAGAEMMGENVKDKLKRCGEGVRLMPLAKVANPGVVELDDHCRLRDFVFFWGGKGIKIGKYSDIQPHVVGWGGGNWWWAIVCPWVPARSC